MTATACPICLKIVDARGYNSHVRACESKQKDKENETMTKDTPEKEIEKDVDIKNPKASTPIKVITWVLGVIVVIVIGVLMLLSPRSKESSKKESTAQPQQRISRRLR